MAGMRTIAHRTKQSNWNEAARNEEGGGGSEHHTLLNGWERNAKDLAEAQRGHTDVVTRRLVQNLVVKVEVRRGKHISLSVVSLTNMESVHALQ